MFIVLRPFFNYHLDRWDWEANYKLYKTDIDSNVAISKLQEALIENRIVPDITLKSNDIIVEEKDLWCAKCEPFIAYGRDKNEALMKLKELGLAFGVPILITVRIKDMSETKKEEKPLLTCIFRENPATPEGKYLVTRRDGTIVECPSFVLLAPDPDAADTIRDYANRVEKRGKAHPGFIESLRRWADTYDKYRESHEEGDPERGKHRVDDPETLKKMEQGMSA